jgi:hypothetical protein
MSGECEYCGEHCMDCQCERGLNGWLDRHARLISRILFPLSWVLLASGTYMILSG